MVPVAFRKPTLVIALAACGLLSSPAALACATCFGEPDAPQTKGMSMAILTLLGCTGSVLAAMVGFVGSMAWRIRRIDRMATESAHALPGARP